MLARVKYHIIWFLDWVVDDRILRHRFTWYCEWLVDHPWWGESACDCEYCMMALDRD